MQQLHQGIFNITGRGVFKEEFVSWGVTLKEINFKTWKADAVRDFILLESVLISMALQEDLTFQNAWSTAYLSAQ